jgi:hypothetical protein
MFVYKRFLLKGRPFSLLSAEKNRGLTKVKKVFSMSLPNHREDFRKSSRRLYKGIEKTFLFHREDFFNLYEDFKKNQYDAFTKPL